MPYVICLPYLALLFFYCVLEKQKRFWPATLAKVVLSAMAAGCALAAASLLKETASWLFALGLFFAVPADFFLQYIQLNLKKYRFGIFFFGAMHVCLLMSFYLQFPITVWEFVIWALLIGILLFFQTREKWKMGKEKGQLTAYTVLVTLMAAKAMSLVIAAPSAVTLAASLGGLCFFLSDIFLGIWDYYRDRFVFLALNRIIYFAGQLCLAFYLVLHLF